jgi:general secretion pathway protein D
VADDSKNAILMEATLADYRRLMKVIETLDVVPNQVLIDATMLMTDSDQAEVVGAKK